MTNTTTNPTIFGTTQKPFATLYVEEHHYCPNVDESWVVMHKLQTVETSIENLKKLDAMLAEEKLSLLDGFSLRILFEDYSGEWKQRNDDHNKEMAKSF